MSLLVFRQGRFEFKGEKISGKSSILPPNKETGKLERTHKNNNLPPQEILKAAKIEKAGHPMGAPSGDIELSKW